MSELATVRIPRPYETAFGSACSRLRSLQPEHPRVYAAAAMAEQGKRRWWALSTGLREGRIDLMYRRHAAEMISATAASEVVATALIHAVLGRVAALWVADGRAWDPGLENVWIHTDNDGGIDWTGLADTTIRVVAGDPLEGSPGVVSLPCERAMWVWLAYRCEPSLLLIQGALARCAGLGPRRFSALVAESVSGATTYVPDLARTDPVAGARRGQGLLMALEERGMAIRRAQRVA